MTFLIIAGTFISSVQLNDSLRLTPERTTIRQGDPLLCRVDLCFGLRPSCYRRGPYELSPATRNLVLSVRGPGRPWYQIVRTSGYNVNALDETHRIAAPVPEPYDSRAAVFVWLLADRDTPVVFDTPGEFHNRDDGPRQAQRVPRAAPLFDAVGDYSIRARVVLLDTRGFVFAVHSPPVIIRVEPQDPAVLAASAKIRDILYYFLKEDRYLPNDSAPRLREALPELGTSGSASAVRRLLALDALRDAPPGEPRSRAVAECDRVLAGLPAVGQAAFSLALASNFVNLHELDLANKHLNATPAGPRRLVLSDYYNEKAQRLRRP